MHKGSEDGARYLRRETQSSFPEEWAPQRGSGRGARGSSSPATRQRRDKPARLWSVLGGADRLHPVSQGRLVSRYLSRRAAALRARGRLPTSRGQQRRARTRKSDALGGHVGAPLQCQEPLSRRDVSSERTVLRFDQVLSKTDTMAKAKVLTINKKG